MRKHRRQPVKTCVKCGKSKLSAQFRMFATTCRECAKHRKIYGKLPTRRERHYDIEQDLSVQPPPPIAPGRMEDHDDCAHYSECLMAAAKTSNGNGRLGGKRRVCEGCDRYELQPPYYGEIIRTNFATPEGWSKCG